MKHSMVELRFGIANRGPFAIFVTLVKFFFVFGARF